MLTLPAAPTAPGDSAAASRAQLAALRFLRRAPLPRVPLACDFGPDSAMAAPVTSSNSQSQLHLLTCHTVDSSPSLLVNFDQHKYLFNVPESLSRVCVQSKIGLKKVGKVFLGNLNEASAGLPGYLLSTVEAGNRDVELVGTPGLDHLVASYRFYTRREQLALKLTVVPPAKEDSHTTLPAPIHVDNNLAVYAFPHVSSAPPSVTHSPLSPSLKRPRSSQSPPPARRSKSPPGLASDNNSSELPRPTSYGSPYSNPEMLLGDEAIKWRNLVISDMFRGGGKNEYRSRMVQSPAYLIAPLPPLATPAPLCISYLGVGPPIRGEFLAQVAKAKGVKAGPKFSLLVKGGRIWVSEAVYVPLPLPEEPPKSGREPVLSPDQIRGKEKAVKRAAMAAEAKWEASIVDGEGPGHWVESEDCIGPGEDGAAFLVLNLSSPAFLDSLSTIPAELLTRLPRAQLKTVFYFLGPGVLHDPRLLAWMQRLPGTIEHRVSSSDLLHINDPIIFAPTSLLMLRLSRLSPSIFSLPQYTFLPPVSAAHSDLSLLPPGFPATTRIIRPNDYIISVSSVAQAKKKAKSIPAVPVPVAGPISQIRHFDFVVPSLEAEVEAAQLKPLVQTEEVHAAARMRWSGFKEQAAVARAEVEAEERIAKMEERTMEPGDDLVVTPLGTGSAVPSKYRNVSSTLLHLPEGGYVLLDAGEGTVGQMARRFGKDLDKILRELKCVFISHIHQDHHAGMTTLLAMRSRLDPKPEHPLVVIGPQGLPLYCREQQQLFDIGLGYEHRGSAHEVIFVENMRMEQGKTPNADLEKVMSNLRELLGFESIFTVPVLHRCRCWGIVIISKSGWKTVFSGDTMPCEELVKAGKGATLLIHEATIESDMPEVALEKGHSTFAQAVDVARRMEARHCLLTHFSARYPKLPPLDTKEEGETEPIVAVAFDLMTLRLDEFWKMDKYSAALTTLFDEGEAKMEEVEME